MARVLVVDDDDQVRKLFALTLEQHGHTVVHTGSGTKALTMMTEESFDILVTDLIMPDTDGNELIMSVRRQALPLKIIAVSGGGGVGGHVYLNTARQLGADLTLEKPVSGARLAEAVGDVLAIRQNWGEFPADC